MPWLVGALALLALVAFGAGLFDDSFVDEYAYITQSYYSDLFFGGRRDDPAWIEDFAFDLQPLPKYFIGPALHAAGVRMPGPLIAYRWYQDAHTRFGPPETLTVARLPFIVTGALGCLALLGLGLLIGGRRAGAIGAALLVADPLFRLHAHRAMSDVPCETFMIAALGLALWGISRIWSGRGIGLGLGLFAAAGVGAGLSIVCKLNGLLAPMTMAAWSGLALLGPGLSGRARFAMAGGAVLSIATMVSTILLLNPAYTSHPKVSTSHAELARRAVQGPLGRFKDMVDYRLETTRRQKEFPKFFRDVVRTPADKLSVFAVQGFGRFGPFGPSKSDSEIRYDLRQDWGCVLWGPLVLFGLFRSLRLGWRQLGEGAPPTSLALVVWALLSWTVVATYLPLAWDRYFLPIQAPNVLLAAVGLSTLRDRWRRKAVAA